MHQASQCPTDRNPPSQPGPDQKLPTHPQPCFWAGAENPRVRRKGRDSRGGGEGRMDRDARIGEKGWEKGSVELRRP